MVAMRTPQRVTRAFGAKILVSAAGSGLSKRTRFRQEMPPLEQQRVSHGQLGKDNLRQYSLQSQTELKTRWPLVASPLTRLLLTLSQMMLTLMPWRMAARTMMRQKEA